MAIAALADRASRSRGMRGKSRAAVPLACPAGLRLKGMVVRRIQHQIIESSWRVVERDGGVCPVVARRRSNHDGVESPPMRFANTVCAIIFLIPLSWVGCSSSPAQNVGSQEPAVTSSTTIATGGMIITDEMIGRRHGAMHLERSATDAAYGYSERSPIKIGGGFESGSERTYRFLNALRGPNGEKVTYTRVGTCCPFKSPNSPFDGEGLLEVYVTSYGVSPPQRLYFNWYDEAEVLLPRGLTAER